MLSVTLGWGGRWALHFSDEEYEGEIQEFDLGISHLKVYMLSSFPNQSWVPRILTLPEHPLSNSFPLFIFYCTTQHAGS